MRDIGAALVALALLNCAQAAAIDREDYIQAQALLSDRIGSLVLNERVVPHWLPGRDEFWYRRETASGHEFVIVDAASGRKRPANKDHVCKVAPAEPECAGTTKVPPGLLISPNGQWGAFTRDGNLWLRDLSKGQERALTNDGQKNFGYGITPDGWKAAFIPRLRSGEPSPPLESYWSPDSKRIVVSRVDQRHVAEYPFVESAPADGSFRPKVHPIRIPLVGERPATLEWFVVDVSSGEHRRIEYPYEKLLVLQQDLLAVRRTWWSPDNERLHAVAFGDNMESAFLFEADLKTGVVRTVVEERQQPRVDLNSTSYNPPNVRVTADGREAIWFSQRDGWGHLYLYDTRTGALKNRITQGDWLVRDIVHVDEKLRRIYFTAGGREPGNPYYRYLYRVNFDGSDLKLLSPEPGDHLITGPGNDLFSLDGAVSYDVISPSGRFAVYNSSPIAQNTQTAPQTIIRRTSDASRVAVIETADATRLFAAGYRAPEEFVVKAADGKTDLYGVMYKPVDFDPSRKYAVIDHQYTSPLTAVVPRNFAQALQGVPGVGSSASFARLGFIVVAIDARGTTYRSREFSQAGFGELNIIGLDDHVAAIRQLAQRFAYIDAERVGITGASFGGWGTLRGMLEFPEFFKVGVAGMPPVALHNMYLDYHLTTFNGRPKYQDGSDRRGADDEVPANWAAVDGRQQAVKLKGKLLMIVGEVDENVPAPATLQFVDALIKANRDFELLYLPNMNHGQSARNAYSIRRTWDFFVRHLLGQEPPAPEVEQ